MFDYAALDKLYDPELQTIGMSLFQPSKFLEALAEGLKPEHFTTREGGVIWQTMVSLGERGMQIEPTNVANELVKLKDQEAYLRFCDSLEFGWGQTNIEYWVKEIIDRAPKPAAPEKTADDIFNDLFEELEGKR